MQNCHIDVNYLDSSNTQSNNIIFGGKFFQEFFGVFTNDYNDASTPDQALKIYRGQNAMYMSYVGNENLPTGPNPFVPVPPTPPEDNSGLGTVWIVVIALIGTALVGFLGFLLYKYNKAVQAAK